MKNAIEFAPRPNRAIGKAPTSCAAVMAASAVAPLAGLPVIESAAKAKAIDAPERGAPNKP
ncbi:hypothetical protein [Sinorhizobium medicae]|uniref:hypothetical protein n=1 Tax=Sinorhizobium medicae TaxID=110321 RepID=UPI001F1A0A50|nr:hypothetical protein [Sinorhizobium medicae]